MTQPVPYYRLYKFYKRFGFLKAFGLLIKPFTGIVISDDDIRDAIRYLKWDKVIEGPLTVDEIRSASALVAFIVFLPLYILLISGAPGLISFLVYYYASFSLAVFLFTIPDKITFPYKYQFTFYTPIVMNVFTTTFVQTGGDIPSAILTLYNMRLAEISRILGREVISPVVLRKTPETIEERFLHWLENECPSTLFSESLMKVVVYAQEGIINPRYFVEQIENTINTIFNALEYYADSSKTKISLTMVFYTLIEMVLYMTVAIKTLFGTSTITNIVGLTLLMVIASPLFIYSLLDAAVKRSFAISRLPTEERLKKVGLKKPAKKKKSKKK